uniref:Uncharacterized protein n=1 Tax=Acrobeloides nanus TaxID=290746 RepID=A0A914CZI7_9BILA
MAYIARSRFHYAATESSDVIKRTEFAVIVLVVVECLALSLFTIVHHQKDGYVQHDLAAIGCFVFAVLHIYTLLFHEFLRPHQISKSLTCTKMASVGIFLATSPITLENYLKFVSNPMCTPLTTSFNVLCEIAMILSYLVFYFCGTVEMNDIEIFIFSSMEDINPKMDEKYSEKILLRIKAEKNFKP